MRFSNHFCWLENWVLLAMWPHTSSPPTPLCHNTGLLFQLSPGVFENVPSVVDEEVKVAVIRDTLRLMDPLKKKTDNQ